MSGRDIHGSVRLVVERSVLAGLGEPGAAGRSDSGHVTVSVAKNGDLAGVRINPSSAQGVDVKRLAADIVQAWRRAQREIFLATQQQACAELGIEPHRSMLDAIEERFGERPARRDEPSARRPARPPRPVDEDEFFNQPIMRAVTNTPRSTGRRYSPG